MKQFSQDFTNFSLIVSSLWETFRVFIYLFLFIFSLVAPRTSNNKIEKIMKELDEEVNAFLKNISSSHYKFLLSALQYTPLILLI